MKQPINAPEKPLCLRKQAAAILIEKAINSAASYNALSFDDLVDILYRYYVEAERGADKERRDAEIAYHQRLAQYQHQKEEQKKEVAEDGRNIDCQPNT